mmetsp:Transcript_28145/g.46313  ORF Transcript_28145/g.46313 Transcript_28145/m.46313 type:complete len:390 (+) Transcript_28145:24-1193(+)
MSRTLDFISYTIAVLYTTILILCVIGIRKNMKKKQSLLQTNEYSKQKGVIEWRYRFYFTLCSATLLRIVCIICECILQQSFALKEAASRQQFSWSFADSFASLLFYSSFTFIVWFFAHLAFHQQPHLKTFITPFFTALNVALYISAITIAISSFATQRYDLLFDYELPLFTFCTCILAVSFIYLSFKISTSMRAERQQEEEYVETSQRNFSLSPYAYRILPDSSAHDSPQQLYSEQHRNIITTVSSYSPQPPVQCTTIFGSANTSNALVRQTPQPVMNAQAYAAFPISSANHIIARLIKLSVLCAVCWLIRGLYLLCLRIWPDLDRTPGNMPERAWLHLFYFITEYPACLGSLLWMICKPKKSREPYLSMQSQQAQGKQQYPIAKQPNY